MYTKIPWNFTNPVIDIIENGILIHNYENPYFGYTVSLSRDYNIGDTIQVLDWNDDNVKSV